MILTIIILVGISIILGVIGGLICEDFIDGVKTFVACILISLIVFMFISLFATIGHTDEVIITNSYNIVSLQDKTETKAEYSGGFIYGYGYIQDQLYYYVAVRYSQGIKIDKYRIDSCYLILDDNITPKIERYNYIRSESQQKRWFMDKDSRELAYYKIFLPKDAIQLDMNYKIDLE
jgi:hypothetical protein